MTSVLNVDTIADKAGSGPVGLTKQTASKCYHLGNSDGTSLLKSFNVASMTDTGTGQQAIAFTNNMDGNFFSVCISPQGNVMDKPYIDAESSSGYRGNMVEGSTFTDRAQSTMQHGNLA